MIYLYTCLNMAGQILARFGRSSKLEMALNMEAQRTGTMIMFNMSGQSSLITCYVF